MADKIDLRTGATGGAPSACRQTHPQNRNGLKETLRRFDLRSVMAFYKSRYTPDNFKPLTFEESRIVAERIAADSQDKVRVLFMEGKTQIWRYNSPFMVKTHHKNPPYIVFLEDARPLIVKPLTDRYAPLHITTEEAGTALLREIGAQTYQVTKGEEFEYLEMLPGDTILDLLMHAKPDFHQDSERLKKIYFLYGITVAEAFVFSIGDRFANTIIDMTAVEACPLQVLFDLYRTGLLSVANIDTATVFNPKMVSNPEAFFLSVITSCGAFLREVISVDATGKFTVLDPHLSRDFLGGFFLRYESLKTDYESGRISRERINSIIEGNFNDPAKTQNQDSVAQRLSYSERQIEKILLLSITLAAVQYLRDDDLELVPFSI